MKVKKWYFQGIFSPSAAQHEIQIHYQQRISPNKAVSGQVHEVTVHIQIVIET